MSSFDARGLSRDQWYRLWPDAGPTPLVAGPELARRCGVAQVVIKDESFRPLGSFKSLGGVSAGLLALARAAGVKQIETLLSRVNSFITLPRLICASDGNHGRAVAAAAEFAGTMSRIYLHQHVPAWRAERIARHGAEIVWIAGTYDDAVDAAAEAAQRGEGLLIADTSSDPHDAVVQDVMNGYSFMAEEIVCQHHEQRLKFPTHLFVQCGVGGLAAALVRGLCETHQVPCRPIVVEPEAVSCVGAALQAGHLLRLKGNLQTAAEMLSAGEASAPALQILCRLQAMAISVHEPLLNEAVELLHSAVQVRTTPSGAAGCAGLLASLPGTESARRLGIEDSSRILLIVTEGAAQETGPIASCPPVSAASVPGH